MWLATVHITEDATSLPGNFEPIKHEEAGKVELGVYFAALLCLSPSERPNPLSPFRLAHKFDRLGLDCHEHAMQGSNMINVGVS